MYLLDIILWAWYEIIQGERFSCISRLLVICGTLLWCPGGRGKKYMRLRIQTFLRNQSFLSEARYASSIYICYYLLSCESRYAPMLEHKHPTPSQQRYLPNFQMKLSLPRSTLKQIVFWSLSLNCQTQVLNSVGRQVERRRQDSSYVKIYNSNFRK